MLAAVERALEGRFWIPRAVAASLALAVVFSVPGYERDPALVARWGAWWRSFVELRTEKPLSDLARHYAPASNQAKRTFRLTGPGFGSWTRTGAAGAFAFSMLCGYVALHVAAALAFGLLGSRAAAFLVTLLLASGYFGTAALKDPFGWFDAIAYAFLLIATAARAPGWRALALLVAFFTDERALLAAPATLLGGALDPEGPRPLRRQAAATLLAVAAYLAIRAAITYAFGLAVATAGIDLVHAADHWQRALASLWSPFEGGWILFAFGAFRLLREGGRTALATAAAGAWFLAYLASCFLVADLTRSMAFAYVVLFPLLAALRSRVEPRRLAGVLLVSALVSLLAPNLFEWDFLDYELSLPLHLLG